MPFLALPLRPWSHPTLSSPPAPPSSLQPTPSLVWALQPPSGPVRLGQSQPRSLVGRSDAMQPRWRSSARRMPQSGQPREQACRALQDKTAPVPLLSPNWQGAAHATSNIGDMEPSQRFCLASLWAPPWRQLAQPPGHPPSLCPLSRLHLRRENGSRRANSVLPKARAWRDALCALQRLPLWHLRRSGPSAALLTAWQCWSQLTKHLAVPSDGHLHRACAPVPVSRRCALELRVAAKEWRGKRGTAV